MQEGQPSQTALHVAAARAAHLRYDPPPHLLGDTLAEPLLGKLGETLIPQYAEGGRWILLENRLFVPFRARFAEDVLADAFGAGTHQLVVLGAGLDSYAFRRPEAQSDLRVFEVDHPSTQRWKQDRIAALGWRVPDDLAFAPCDFERESVSAALRSAGFASDAPAVVTWMGVVYYLSAATLHRALVDLHGVLAPGSAVVLDFMRPFRDLSPRYDEIEAGMTAYLQSAGEPQVSRHRPEQMRDAILAAGFADAELPTRDALRRRYFAPLDSKIPMSERFGVAVARR